VKVSPIFLGNDCIEYKHLSSHTLRSLQQALSYAEMTQIQAASSVKDLHNVATEAQYLSRGGRGRIRSMVETLNQYSGVPDIISRWHPEYSAPAWGTLKWLLVIPMSYINLTQRIAVMLEENGGNRQ
jgi:hypothetical protein